MKIKKLLHLCEMKGCMRFSSCDIEIKHPENGEVLHERKICTKCARELLQSLANTKRGEQKQHEL